MALLSKETIILEGSISPLPCFLHSWSAETPMEPVGDCEDHHDAPGSEVGNEAVSGGHVRSPGIKKIGWFEEKQFA